MYSTDYGVKTEVVLIGAVWIFSFFFLFLFLFFFFFVRKLGFSPMKNSVFIKILITKNIHFFFFETPTHIINVKIIQILFFLL